MTTGQLKYGLKFLLVALYFSLGLTKAEAQINFNYALTGTAASYPVLSIYGSATLTSGGIDLVNNGWLRLTPNNQNQNGYVLVDQAFLSTQGLIAEFDYKSWGVIPNNGYNSLANGISVFLYDATIATANFQSTCNNSGASLGYAYDHTVPCSGATGGYVGVGLDLYGAFSDKDWLNGGVTGGYAQSIGIRGPSGPNRNQTQYVGGTTSNLGNAIDVSLRGSSVGYNTSTSTRPTDIQFYRKARVTLLPVITGGLVTDFAITVQLAITPGGSLLTAVSNVPIGAIPPPTLKIGFCGATGAATANQEIRNLSVFSPIALAVSNTVDLSSARVGDQVNYTTVISNVGINAVSAGSTATLSIETNGVSITSDIIGHVLKNTLAAGTAILFNAAQSTPAKQVYDIINFPIGGTLTLTYTGSISTIVAFSVSATNTATITPPLGFLNIGNQYVSTAYTAIIKDIDLKVDTIVSPTIAQVLGSTLSYTTVISNQGPTALTGPNTATFSLDLTGLANLSTITPQLSGSTLFVKDIALSQQQNKDIYDINELLVGQAITLTYTATIISGNPSAINKATVNPPVKGYYYTNTNTNVSAVQTFIKPVLTQPDNTTIICTGSSVNKELLSDNPSFTSFIWTSVPSANAISVQPSTVGSIIQDVIANIGGTSGTVIYTVTPTITANLVLADGSVSTTTVTTPGDSKTFTVFVRTFSMAPITVLVSGNGIIKYKEDAVFTASSSLPFAKYTWYEDADKANPIFGGVDNGVLSKHALLPGTYIYYVAVSNAEFCEGALFPATIILSAISIANPPNAFTPNGDGIEDTWVIENIEQYSHCDVRIFDRWGNTVYSPTGYNDPWTGNFYGRPLPVATYFYLIDLKDGSKPHLGTVAIIR